MPILTSNIAIKPLDKSEYYLDLISNINQTLRGDRILLVTMALMPGSKEVEEILNCLENAAKRGVKVFFGFDAYNFIMSQTARVPGPLYFSPAWPPATKKAEYEKLLEIQKRLTKDGATVAITNKPKRAFINPYSGRSHIKTAVINNVVYIGGCNLSSVYDLDTMLKFEDSYAADWLFSTISSAIQDESIKNYVKFKDQKHQIDNNTFLYLDAGVKHQSLIYENLLSIIDNAKTWLVLTCQFFPNSTTAHHLFKAHNRGVDVKILFNSPLGHRGVHHIALQGSVYWFERLRMPKSFFNYKLPASKPYLHAKIVANEKEAMIGSHNYVPAGVKFGTAEIAVHRKDVQFAQQIRDFTERLVQ